MKKFMIERTLPNAGRLTQEELAEISKVSCAAIEKLGRPYHWIHTYVTGDKLYCIHIAPDMETVQKHSDLGCFPVDRIYEIHEMIDPSTRV